MAFGAIVYSPSIARIALSVVVALLAVASGSAAPGAPPGGGGQLAFHSEMNGKDSEVYLVDLAKLGSPINLTTHPSRDVSPAWSPNGTEIAFASDRDGSSKVYILEVATKAVQPLVSNGPAGQLNPTWCTDTRLAFAATGDIYVADRETGSARALTSSPSTTESQPACTPDGTRVVFASGTATTRGLFDVAYVGGTTPRRISPPDWLAVDPALSASGIELLFFGRSPDGRVGLWTNGYRARGTIPWRPKLRAEVTPPAELRLTKFEARLPFAWSPASVSKPSFFGTDVPQGSTAPTGTRSLFYMFDGAFRRLGYPTRFGEDANPAPRPLRTIFSTKSFFGLGGTSGSDDLTLTFGDRTITVQSRRGLVGRLFDDPARTVIRGGFSIAYDDGLLRTMRVDLAGGVDRMTIRGTPPRSLRLAIDCGANSDELTLTFARITPTYRVTSCEKITR